MADQDTSIVTGDNLLMVLFSRKAIKTLHEKCLFYQVAEKFPLPPGSGVQMTFNGLRKINAASTTLAEASSNSAVNLSSRKVNVTIASYGRHAKITDLAELVSIIGPVEGAVRELTQAAALTLDNVVQLAVFKSGQTAALNLLQVGQQSNVKTKLLSAWLAAQPSSYCANTGATGTQSGGSAIARNTVFGFPVVFATSATRISACTATVSSTVGPQLFRKMTTRLKRLAVDPMPNGAYVGIAHPNSIASMYANASYRALVVNYAEGPKESYFKATPTHNIFGIQLAESSNVPRYATSALSCSPIFVCGQGALGVVELGGGGGGASDGGPTGAMQIIIKRPGPATVSEPYDLNMTVAFKLRSVAAVLNPSCGVIGLALEGAGVGA